MNQKKSLPQFVIDMISSRPRAGRGVHSFLFKVARQLHHHRSKEDIFKLLEFAVEDCGREVPDGEIWNAIENSAEVAWKPGGDSSLKPPRRRKWPSVDETARKNAIRSNDVKTLQDLTDRSLVSCRPAPSTEEIIDILLPGNPLICVGESSSNFTTIDRESLRGMLSSKSLIVPSAMSALTGKVKNKDYQSPHTLDNTGPRQYLVTEFDAGSHDEQASLIWHLTVYAPLRLVVHSGGKSLHAWWECVGQKEEDVMRFMKYAVSLGADPATWTRSQFVRMPGGLRNGKLLQQVHYFSPASKKEVA